jgi:hypothetical protein
MTGIDNGLGLGIGMVFSLGTPEEYMDNIMEF